MIVEGIVEKKSKSSSRSRNADANDDTFYTGYEFWIIDGKRYRRVRTDSYLDSIVEVGKNYKLSFAKIKKWHTLCAIITPEGEIIKTDNDRKNIIKAIFFSVALAILGAVALGAFSGSMGGLIVGFAFVLVLMYFTIGKHFKNAQEARKAFD